MTEYRPTPFSCGNCDKPLDFMVRTWPIAGAWYVHREDHRFRCHGRWLSGPSTQSKGIK